MKREEKVIKITQAQLVYENDYGNLYDDEVVFLPGGYQGKYVRWIWKATYSVAVLPIMSTGKVKLVNNFRHAARKLIIEAPKGFGEKDKTPEEIAKKELQEELGLKSDLFTSLGECITDPSFSYLPMYLFIAWNCIPTEGGPSPEVGEVFSEPIEITLENPQNMVEKDLIHDAVTLLLMWNAYSLIHSQGVNYAG
jgi:ADP-ribose pyrophosphatase